MEATFLGYPFIVIAITGICLLFAIIPHCISNRLNKEGKKMNITKKIKIHKFILIIVTTIFDYGETLIDNFYYDLKVSQFLILNFIIITLFSYFILKIKLYKHQFFCLIIMFFCGIGLYIIEPKYYKRLKLIILQISFEICFCLIFILSKYLMDFKFCSPYELCFYHGIFFAIFTGISYIFFYKYDKKDVDFSSFKCNYKEILGMICYMTFTFIFNLFTYITIRIYNPFYTIFIFIIMKIGVLLISFEKKLKLYLTIIILCVLIFIMMIFNEILILNFCGFEKNIKTNLEKKALEENEERSHDSNLELEDYKIDLFNNEEYEGNEEKEEKEEKEDKEEKEESNNNREPADLHYKYIPFWEEIINCRFENDNDEA